MPRRLPLARRLAGRWLYPGPRAAGGGARTGAGTMARFAAAALLLLPALTARAAAMAPVPAAASGHWRVGSLDLAPCDIGGRHATGVPTQAAYCTTFDVPEDWDTPQGRHIGLRVALVRGSAPDNDPDIVAFLDGGPGGAATEDYPPIAPALAPLRKRHHLLLVDQRGTGGSNALDCGDDIALDTDKPAPPARAATFSGAPRRAAGEPGPAQRRAATQRCIAALAPRAALQFYTTTDAVRDLEAVRQALGGPPLDLVGVSYGTRVAQHYAARYPQSVRSIVLDSPVPNRLALPGEHARNMEDALRQRLARCGATPACAQRFGDSYAAAHLVHERLRRQDVAVELADPLSFALAPRRLGADDFAQLLRFYLYSDATSALLPLVIDAAREGRYAPVLGQVRLVEGDVAEHLSNGMAASVMCTEAAMPLLLSLIHI